MPDNTPEPTSTPSLTGLIGYRAIISAAVLGAFNALRVFGLVEVTQEQAEAINGLLSAAVALFLALKGLNIQAALASIQGTASATAATAISTAKEVGAEHVADPAVADPAAGKVG